MNKKLIIILVAVVVLIAAVAGILLFVLGGNDSGEKVYYYSPGEEFITNTKDGESTLVKVNISLGLTTDKKDSTLEEENAKIRDIIVTCLRNKTKAEYQDTNIKTELSAEICEELQKQFDLDIFRTVYFSDMVVQ